jgi:hypothetical protein
MPESKKSKLSGTLATALFCLAVLGVMYFPLTVLFCGCMLPAFVAALVDNKPDRTAGVTVGTMNLAGTVPAWLELFSRGGQVEDAVAMLLMPQTLLVAYVAAAIGWMFYLQVPVLVSGVMVKRNQRRLVEIDRRQQELVRKWGTRIAGEAQSAVKDMP